MKLNKNSNLSKIYRWFYNQCNMPSNLCLYFWKLVFMFVFILPSAILSLPYTVYEKFNKNSHNPILGLFGWFLLYLAFCVLAALSSIFVSYNKDSLMFDSSMTGWLVIIVFLVVRFRFYIIYLRDRYIKKRASNHKEHSNIILEFVKAKQNNVCPQITWEDELKPQTKTN